MKSDDLKTLWNKPNDQINNIAIDNQAINQAKTNKTNDVIQQFKQVLYIEGIVSFVLSVLSLVFFWQAINWQILLFLTVVNAWYLVVGSSLIKKINACQKQQSIRVYLESVLEVLQAFVKHYKLICYVIIPISAVLGVALALKITQTALTQQTYYAMGISIVLSIVLVVPLSYWWINYFYERKINKIKALLKSLNE